MSFVAEAAGLGDEPAPGLASLREAAEWFARLQDEDVPVAEHEQWQQWLAASSDNRRAWQRVEAVSREFAAVTPADRTVARQVMAQAGTAERVRGRNASARRPSRRAAIKTLALLLSTGLAAWFAAGRPRLGSLLASARTAIGEQRQLALADGSILWLNTASAADVRFTGELRRLCLHEGEILVQTHPDSVRPARPFVVDTAHGRLQALGTRFVVRQFGTFSELRVLDGAVQVEVAAGAGTEPRAGVVIEAGRYARFDATRIIEGGELPAGGVNWHRGSLLAEDMRLDDFIAELARYRRGRLVCDPAVGGLRVMGSFRLQDTDAILDMLQKSMPVRVRRITPWWVSVGPV